MLTPTLLCWPAAASSTTAGHHDTLGVQWSTNTALGRMTHVRMEGDTDIPAPLLKLLYFPLNSDLPTSPSLSMDAPKPHSSTLSAPFLHQRRRNSATRAAVSLTITA